MPVNYDKTLTKIVSRWPVHIMGGPGPMNSYGKWWLQVHRHGEPFTVEEARNFMLKYWPRGLCGTRRKGYTYQDVDFDQVLKKWNVGRDIG